jgi:hypothetical protein
VDRPGSLNVLTHWPNVLAVCNVAIRPETPETTGNPHRAQE